MENFINNDLDPNSCDESENESNNNNKNNNKNLIMYDQIRAIHY